MIKDMFENYLSKIYVPKISIGDIVEILIITFIIYYVMLWIKDTRAWMLLKGIAVIIIFALVAVIFNLSTILWIASKTLNVGIIAVDIIFHPEIRRALEQLGRNKLFKQINLF